MQSMTTTLSQLPATSLTSSATITAQLAPPAEVSTASLEEKIDKLLLEISGVEGWKYNVKKKTAYLITNKVDAAIAFDGCCLEFPTEVDELADTKLDENHIVTRSERLQTKNIKLERGVAVFKNDADKEAAGKNNKMVSITNVHDTVHLYDFLLGIVNSENFNPSNSTLAEKRESIVFRLMGYRIDNDSDSFFIDIRISKAELSLLQQSKELWPSQIKDGSTIVVPVRVMTEALEAAPHRKIIPIKHCRLPIYANTKEINKHTLRCLIAWTRPYNNIPTAWKLGRTTKNELVIGQKMNKKAVAQFAVLCETAGITAILNETISKGQKQQLAMHANDVYTKLILKLDTSPREFNAKQKKKSNAPQPNSESTILQTAGGTSNTNTANHNTASTTIASITSKKR